MEPVRWARPGPGDRSAVSSARTLLQRGDGSCGLPFPAEGRQGQGAARGPGAAVVSAAPGRARPRRALSAAAGAAPAGTAVASAIPRPEGGVRGVMTQSDRRNASFVVCVCWRSGEEQAPKPSRVGERSSSSFQEISRKKTFLWAAA